MFSLHIDKKKNDIRRLVLVTLRAMTDQSVKFARRRLHYDAHVALRCHRVQMSANRRICLKVRLRETPQMSSSNIFEDLLRLHGPECFRRSDRMSRIKNSLCRYIKASGNYKKVVKTVIGDAVRFHRRHSVRDGKEADHVCTTHPVIVLAAHLCQKYNIDDEPELLRDILMSVFLCDGGFDRFVTFLDPLIFPFEVDPIIYPFQNMHSIGTISQRHLEVLEYFLSQATRITVPVELSEFCVTDCQQPSYKSYYTKVPFVEMPIFSSRGSTPLLLACHSINAPAVLLLLRYGADPMRAGQAHQIIGLYFQVRSNNYRVLLTCTTTVILLQII